MLFYIVYLDPYFFLFIIQNLFGYQLMVMGVLLENFLKSNFLFEIISYESKICFYILIFTIITLFFLSINLNLKNNFIFKNFKKIPFSKKKYSQNSSNNNIKME